MSDQIIHLFDRPVAFHAAFVHLPVYDSEGNEVGKLGVLGALMLSQAIYWTLRTQDPDGWFCKTREDWQKAIGLGRWEQETARRRLRGTGFWHEERRGVPARLYFRVDFAGLNAALRRLYPDRQPVLVWSKPLQEMMDHVLRSYPCCSSEGTHEVV